MSSVIISVLYMFETCGTLVGHQCTKEIKKFRIKQPFSNEKPLQEPKKCPVSSTIQDHHDRDD